MKSFSASVFIGSLALAACGLAGCQNDVATPAIAGTVTLHLDNGVTMPNPTTGTPTFGSLVLGSGAYVNANGDDFTVSTFKYYLSNVKLLKADNSTYALPKTYYLVDQTKPASQELVFSDVPVGDYTGIIFVVGVDSARTKAGNFTEAVLNAGNGMLWTMNGVDEFINVSLSGYSSKARSGGLTFHIAGYKQASTNTIRTVTAPFPTANSPMLVRPDHAPEIHLQVDIARMFSGPNLINFTNTYNVMGGAPAVKVADNIAAGMFTVDHIHAN
ncbi:MbnP family protein [Hymenobacter antarcticus]|uniref:Copper-binding protein MbnP-like domain-containing protein n=1 Tax=Hymenobacter antarcticus TaxID=486270 RepID=A0ABP7PJG1_9BACT